jgi:tetratricopeptide (TPR) repeat protein
LTTRRYTLAEASRLLRMPRRLIDALVAAGFVTTGRTPRGHSDVGFQDLVVLRAAQNLVAARLPAARIARTLASLRRKLPEVPPSRLRVEAVGRSIVVREGEGRFVADSGQYLLAFDVAAEQGEVRFIGKPVEAPSGADWLDRAAALEDDDPEAAVEAYRQAIQADPASPAAYANLGRLLHARGQLDDAAAVYERGRRQARADATLLFNYAVLLEDREALAEAAQRYREALALEPQFADAHCNLGLLYERLGEAQGALRHLRTYRQLAAR